MCTYCQSSANHRNQHEEKALDFYFNEAKVKFNLSFSNEGSDGLVAYYNGRNTNEKELCLYNNSLMMPYKYAIEDAPLDKDEKILLDEKF